GCAAAAKGAARAKRRPPPSAGSGWRCATSVARRRRPGWHFRRRGASALEPRLDPGFGTAVRRRAKPVARFRGCGFDPRFRPIEEPRPEPLREARDEAPDHQKGQLVQRQCRRTRCEVREDIRERAAPKEPRENEKIED